ncbi:hypothetical protein [Occallatibacter riparius]|uniref:Uncharacterized protein n=1 Tax=Occallatibacter riparius TaxID=1002689 RepID=A0A9J7BUU3_9BACT|nr:hypothetical protein [Occallatibacter riparius]UWZ86337.1 hypothetical protein MOP44_10410 [Occallatibacter riparius]
MDSEQIESLTTAFRDQLLACLEECAHGRRGLFAEYEHLGEEHAWPEAGRLRELAAALQSILAQDEERDALIDEFLDLCTMHGEYDPGEPRLAREFMRRIDRGEVGTPTQKEPPWKGTGSRE